MHCDYPIRQLRQLGLVYPALRASGRSNVTKKKNRPKDIKRKLAEYLPTKIATCSVPLVVTRYDLPGVSQKI